MLRCIPARWLWLTRDNSLLHSSFIDEFQLLPVPAVLSRRSLFVSIQTRISVGTLCTCSLVPCACSEPDCEAVWTRDEFSADCSLDCRRRICTELHHLLLQSFMYCTDLRHGNCCWLLCHDGKLRSWSFHGSAGVSVHWQLSSWDVTICSDRALLNFTV